MGMRKKGLRNRWKELSGNQTRLPEFIEEFERGDGNGA